MSKKLDDLFKDITKEEGEGVIAYAKEEVGNVEYSSFGIKSLDSITGGGIPKGRIVEIFGPDGSYKTTIALMGLAEAQKSGVRCAFINAEFTFDNVYAESLGVNTDDLIIVNTSTTEKVFDIAMRLIDTGEVGLIVIDSVASLVPKAENEGDFGASNMGVAARLMGQLYRKITEKLNKNNCSLILINQLRDKLGGYVVTKTTPGGNATAFYATLRLDIKKAAIKKGDDVVGVKLTIKTMKNKLGTPFLTTEVDTIYGEGVDIVKDILGVAVDKGVIEKGGAGWLTYNGTKVQGLDNFKQLCKDNPELLEEIKSKI